MSEKLRESLSAVVDDEADEFELRRVLDELAKDPGLKASWARYHMIGTVLRGEYAHDTAGLKERVWQELSIDSFADQQNQAPEQSGAAVAGPEGIRHTSRWVSLSIAAAIAFLVVVGLGNLSPDQEQPRIAAQTSEAAEAQSTVDQSLALTQPLQAASPLALQKVVTPLDAQRAEAYKVAHSQQRFMIIASDPNAFAKMVSYQRR